MQIGERIAFYRQRRGYTQSQLAGLVGRSTDWLSKIERGDRQIRRVDLLTEVAAALRVTPGDLMGQPVLLEDDQERDNIPAIRDALMAPGRLSRVLFATIDAPPRTSARPSSSSSSSGPTTNGDGSPRWSTGSRG